MEVLRLLNVPFQLFPNSWNYIMAFDMVCKDLDVTPTMGVFFPFLCPTPITTNFGRISLPV